MLHSATTPSPSQPLHLYYPHFYTYPLYPRPPPYLVTGKSNLNPIRSCHSRPAFTVGYSRGSMGYWQYQYDILHQISTRYRGLFSYSLLHTPLLHSSLSCIGYLVNRLSIWGFLSLRSSAAISIGHSKVQIHFFFFLFLCFPHVSGIQ